MKSLWNDDEVRDLEGDALALRVHTSRLLGREEDLVLHGGGNTSVKDTVRDFFGREVEVLHVKGSGWNLETIEKPGFSPLRLTETRALADRERLSDREMTRELRNLLLDQTAPNPSVEAILHALLPPRFVDHTHADAVVTLSNTPDGASRIRALYPDCLVLPYVMPGFVLARQVREAIAGEDLSSLKGIILLHHGVFTFAEEAREAYETMISLVTRAEEALAKEGRVRHPTGSSDPDLLDLARIRRAVSRARGLPQLALLDTRPEAVGYATRDDVGAIATRGPITPDHVLRTKRAPVILPPKPDEDVPEVTGFAQAYAEEFAALSGPEHTMLDPAPRAAVWKDMGTIAFGSSLRECGIVRDIARHTAWAVQTGESLGGWTALSRRELFELEYWELEQAKLGKKGAPPSHQGRVALVTGAASGIGRATAEALRADGAEVVGLDVSPAIEELDAVNGLTGLRVDVRDAKALREAVRTTVRRFGGLDLLVACAGSFHTGETIDELDTTWDETLELNLGSVQRLLKEAIPFLRHGVDASVVLVGSRNVAAPGAGAAAYSVSKAGLTQLARVAALELAAHDVRVNVVHPDAVFDTGLWTEEALARSAARYGLSVEDYKKRNLLGRTIRSAEVGRLISTVLGPVFSATTGAQIPIDGGNDRVI